MFTKLAPVIAITLVSGCTLTNSEQYHKETLAAIQTSETNSAQRFDRIEVQMADKDVQITNLNTKIDSLNAELRRLRQQAISQMGKPRQEVNKSISIKTSSSLSEALKLGEIEKITINSVEQKFDARIDTGEETSSLNAVDIEEFERNGKNWIRFHLSDGTASSDKTNWIEAPIVRFKKIRQSTNSQIERRPVVELWVRLGKIHEKTQFTLADRSQMIHPVLLGRDFIRDIAVVDVSKKYIQTEIEQK
ncbi:ATP-dependent zinc protease family protein [Vibrio hepatarius]|uniref:ATP-dependent zinc protease family protein n=1 Tax=Vibrio hepatarius TaxID=171383 RepID=UPI001C0A5DF7|nr:ATP-dependent zinc protease [Vibrio hepatarius]MBU2895406.1 ATP-dependent zinc protease [Vibrio hepatarius]